MRIAIIGNSGSGKSTLAKRFHVPMLDLDTVYWERGKIAVQRDPAEAVAEVRAVRRTNKDWAIEDCYASLIEVALEFTPELILLDPGVDACIRHCEARHWEPHKYASKQEQDQHLAFLLEWVRGYYTRDGEMSLQSHEALYNSYAGPKRRIVELSTGEERQ
ncbi:MAG: shikimate kinase [Acidobacteria bacterium]|nr:shikimate kinase [Acidobacteriota bacterium]